MVVGLGQSPPEAEAYVGAQEIAKFHNFVLFCAIAFTFVSATSIHYVTQGDAGDADAA